jgi:hypothetical protein
MSFPFIHNVKEEKMESLRTQYEFLNLLRLRHLQWMNTADDSQMEGVHLEIAELIEQITDSYRELFGSLSSEK